ncbi:DUF1064 domain-containing protein [Campylobacter suis]|uniref:DUF1064 domain-containing protein n=1 Tax=Campylobacter suis TaxID=2790657 RepID=A0ABM8Q5T7_9BACT|nr:DUF1064 domain-containing protein [Campylobacter suis]CAD7288245.1 hypothetical protein LMG8286_01213 [Campylobacter suis]
MRYYKGLTKQTGKALQKKKHKYNARKTNDYDSAKEAKRAKELELFLKQGLIKELQKQVRFELQPKFTAQGKSERAITYIADFVYTQNGETIIEDVKGYKTKEYLIKRKLLLKLIADGKIKAEFREV